MLGMTVVDYVPILLQLGLALALGLGILGASYLVGQKGSRNKIKDTPYECGIIGSSKGGARFAVKFYITAMLFILFDIEVVFLVPWVLVYREFLQASIPILLPMLFFIGVLGIGLMYEFRRGALKWES